MFLVSVGGISIKEHFEVNVAPLKLQLTRKFAKTVKKYFFPQRSKEKEATVSGSSALINPVCPRFKKL